MYIKKLQCKIFLTGQVNGPAANVSTLDLPHEKQTKIKWKKAIAK